MLRKCVPFYPLSILQGPYMFSHNFHLATTYIQSTTYT